MSFHPHTPQSPSQFSPATSDPLSSMNSSLTSITTALPTPAHSVNGSSSQPPEMSHDIVMSDDTPHKRKRALDDVGDRDQKKLHMGDDAEEGHEISKIGIELLHMDVGPKFLFCKTPLPPPNPRLSEDLFEMYNLGGLAAEVAREKPNGEKNALRKTYKGHIKRLGITGHFDAHKHDSAKDSARESLVSMLAYPDLEWTVHEVKNKEVGNGLSEQVTAVLGRAMTMARGKIVSKVWDASVLGDLAPGADGARQGAGKPIAPGTPGFSTPGGTARPKVASATAPGQDANRPKRNIKKRSYGDSSFEGYGEGYPDDDGGMETGYSSGGGEGGQKRRKKVSPGSPEGAGMSNQVQNAAGAQSQYPTSGRQQSYGPGMVGA